MLTNSLQKQRSYIPALFVFLLVSSACLTAQTSTRDASPQNNGQPAPQENLPNAPSSSSKEPSLSDLGISPEQTQGNAREQALLDRRTHMLKVHQRMGLITTIPLIATVLLGPGAGANPVFPWLIKLLDASPNAANYARRAGECIAETHTLRLLNLRRASRAIARASPGACGNAASIDSACAAAFFSQ